MQKWRRGKCLALAVLFALCSQTVAYAKVGPEDYYDSYKQKTRYKVGSDIDSGMYVLFNTSDTKNASISIKRDGKNVLSDTFWNNYILDVEDEDIINVVNGYLVDYEDAKNDIVSSEDGFYAVGEQIDAGTYSVEFIRSTDNTATFTVWKSFDYDSKTAYQSTNLSRGGKATVTIEDGQFIQLNGCRLTYEKEK